MLVNTKEETVILAFAIERMAWPRSRSVPPVSPTAGTSSTTTTPTRRSARSASPTCASRHAVRHRDDAPGPLTGEWVSIAAARQNRVMLPSGRARPARPGHSVQPVRDPGPLRRRRLREPSRRRSVRSSSTTTTPRGARRPRAGGARPHPHLRRPLRSRLLQPGDRRLLRKPQPVTCADRHRGRADRTTELSALPGVRQVFPFENRGEAIGVTLHNRTGRSTPTPTSRRGRRP